MNLTHTIKQISPMLAVADMKETIRFYSEVLGFEICTESPEYSIIERDGCSIHLMKAADESVMEAVRGHTDVYIRVSGVHALWDHAQKFKDQFKMRGLLEREYGMTEFHISDPNECLIFVGEPTSRAS